jgi:hypothetical protein
MQPAERLRRVVHDRVRRHRLARLDLSLGQVITAWPEPAPAEASADSPVRTDDQRADRPAQVALVVALALCFGAVLGFAGSGALQETLRSLGLAAEPAVETVQRKQAATIAQLDVAVHALNAAVAGLSVHADVDGSREAAATRRLVQVDADIAALRTGMAELRVAQDAAADADAWRGPVAQVGAAVKAARSEIAGLRASIAELGQVRSADLGALRGRIDRLEQAMVEHELIAPMRGALRDGDATRATAARVGSPGQGNGGPVPSMPMVLR